MTDEKLSSEAVRELFASWHGQPVEEIERLILRLRRAAVHQHLTPKQWDTIDRMRKYVSAAARQDAPRTTADLRQRGAPISG